METINLKEDITVMYIIASSFPEGIAAAHQKLHQLVPFSADRRFYGISRPEKGKIVYRAAAEILEKGEAEKYSCETLVLKKGNYTAKNIHNYLDRLCDVSPTFEELLREPNIDPDGYCVEWYVDNKDLKCMVRLAD